RVVSRPPVFAVRRATPRDAPAVLDCLRAAFEPSREKYTPAAFESTVLTLAIAGERFAAMTVFVAATPDDVIVGTVACGAIGGGEGHLLGMAVRPDWQGRGGAGGLLGTGEAGLPRGGCRGRPG